MTEKRRRFLMLGGLVAVIFLASVAVALAYTENYGGRNLCGSPSGNCYIESAAAHTFYVNSGNAIGQATYLACQLFQKSGTVNQVSHGYHSCLVEYDGGQYVWARVYNESAFTDYVAGQAITR